MKCVHCGREMTITPETRKDVVMLFATGLTMRKIVEQLKGKVSLSSVSRIIQEYVKEKESKDV